ncbi:hypothetical protein HII17_16840 [Thalassotalea sp. M1531]|uniref:Uncharacterized protein n=1 Tax=Thalassotalea algicola TaxID=2716224 RepID=A0A7Y0LFJ4_9GAMM|nr:hypothetical protein [Thalassotalea algicola]NMP33222.1 hypothetical protein [Thalassotalea algicola]
MLSRIIDPSGLYIADYALFLNILLSSALLIAYALLWVCNTIKLAINNSPFIHLKFASLIKANGYLFVSGLITTAFYLVIFSWQSSECGFGYALGVPTKFCFEESITIFPVSYLTLAFSQATLIILYSILVKRN